MKLINIFISLIIILVFPFCRKHTTRANFHGRVTYECDGSPVRGVELNILQVWNSTAQASSYLVGTTTTDADGNYSLSADVKVVENFNYYKVSLTEKINPKPYYFMWNVPSAEYKSQDEDISLNLTVPAYQRVYLHIKNVAPHDNTDKVASITQKKGSSNYFSLSPDLEGMNVDTVIEGRGVTDYPFRFEYVVYRNFVTDHITDSLVLSCFSDSINLFY